jgi:predicted O-methyltransferase YrrM
MNNTLTSSPLAPLLDQLLVDSEATKMAFKERMGNLSKEERTNLMNATDPFALYSAAKDIHLAVSRETGLLLYILAKTIRARSIVEFGASFGVSTLYLAAALRDNGGGLIISSEFEPTKVLKARENLARANLSDLVELREGDALHTLRTDLPSSIDLLFLDGAKQHYRQVLNLIEPFLRGGAIILADNSDGAPEFLQHVECSGGYISTRFNDLELSVRLLNKLDCATYDDAAS